MVGVYNLYHIGCVVLLAFGKGGGGGGGGGFLLLYFFSSSLCVDD